MEIRPSASCIISGTAKQDSFVASQPTAKKSGAGHHQLARLGHEDVAVRHCIMSSNASRPEPLRVVLDDSPVTVVPVV
jgi:hypothetical protein